jgi:fumarate hydratase class II
MSNQNTTVNQVSQDISSTANRIALEEHRRFITTDAGIINTLLQDLIQQRPFSSQRRTTARAVAIRLAQRAADLRILLQEPNSLLPEIDIPEEPSDDDSTATEQYEQLGDTSVAAFRAAIRQEAVELTVSD